MEEVTLLKYVLAADIGGTYTRIGVYTPRGVRKVYHRFENVHYASAAALFHDFRLRHPLQFSRASIAVAGPVRDGEVRMPNLAWHISPYMLTHALLVKKVAIHNDAYAATVAIADGTATMMIKKGKAEHGPIAILAPGTGLGSAYATCDGKNHVAQSAEFGHAEYAPSTTKQMEFFAYMHQRFGHVSNERVVSGPGLVALYHYLREQKAAPESVGMRAVIDASHSPAKNIVDAAIAGTDALAQETVRQFVEIFAAMAGSYALAVGATAGVYLYGSLANRLALFMTEEGFAAPFARKGRMRPFLEKIPVHIVKDPDIVLTGAYILS